MKKVLIVLITMIIFSLNASEQRDFRFIEELYQRDELVFAKQEITSFLSKYPQSSMQAKAKYYSAMISFLGNNFEEADKALELLESNLTDQEIRPLIFLGLIQTKFFLDQFVESDTYADRFIQDYGTHSKVGEAFYWKGRISLGREDLVNAEKNLNLALQSEQSAMINYLAFQIHLKKGDVKASRAILDSTYSTYSGEFVNQIILEWFDYLYQKLDYASIVRDSRFKIESYSRLYSDYAIILGQAYYKLHKYDRALSLLKSIHPTTSVKQFHIALVYKAKGDLSLAKSLFEELATDSNDERVKELSFFEMVNSSILVPAGSETLKASTIEANEIQYAKVENFVSTHPQSKYLGSAYYLLGYIKYLNEEYSVALDWLLQANNSQIDSDTAEKLLFIMGDIYFLTVQKSKAIPLFTYYIELYPKGRFYDEVLYKIGLTYFDSNIFDSANESLAELAKDYPRFKNMPTVYFYLAEINVINNRYGTALDWLKMSLKNSSDATSVWLRIAEVNYHLGEWQEAFNALANVPESPLYAFRTNIIKANIYYNLKDYDQAISYYQIASDNAVNEAEIGLVTSRIGWTYYLKQDYKEAERVFRTLSNFSTTSEDYLILAGNSASNGKRYVDAISLFEEFLLSYPASAKFNYVTLNLSDCYYNMGKFEDAFETYSKILKNAPSRKELKNSLLGIKWSVLNDKSKDYRSDLATLAHSLKSDVISKALTQIILLYENETEQWDSVIKTAQELLTQYPEDIKNKTINKNLALAYSKTNNFSQADSVYSKLVDWHHDAEIFVAWSDAFLTRKDTLKAVEVLEEAIKLTNESDIWLRTLELKLASRDNSFESTYQNFLAVAEELPKSYAELLNVERNLENGVAFDESVINKKADSDDSKISSLAFYLLGRNSFLKEDFAGSALYLMRVIYLYPEYKELNAKANYYLILAQLEQGQKSKAQKNYDLAKDDLSTWQANHLRQKLFK